MLFSMLRPKGLPVLRPQGLLHHQVLDTMRPQGLPVLILLLVQIQVQLWLR